VGQGRTSGTFRWLLERTCGGKKGQSFLETSRKDDHMPWPPRSLETSRRSIHLALAKKTSIFLLKIKI